MSLRDALAGSRVTTSTDGHGWVVSGRSRSVSPLKPLAGGGPLHIEGKDRGEAAGLAHSASPAANRRPDRSNSRSSRLRRGCGNLGMGAEVISLSRTIVSRASSGRPICA